MFPLPPHHRVMATPASLDAMRSRGFTITELLVVVIILAVIATVAVPNLRSTDNNKLDLAATKVAEAIRLARSESMRTGDVYGITISQTSQQVRVRRYDLSTDPVSAVETLYHPVAKQPLDFDFDNFAPTNGVRITNTQDIFSYTGTSRRRTVLFDRQGVPIWIIAGGPTTHALDTGIIELSLDGRQQTVEVAAYTGRVTIP